MLRNTDFTLGCHVGDENARLDRDLPSKLPPNAHCYRNTGTQDVSRNVAAFTYQNARTLGIFDPANTNEKRKKSVLII